MLINIFGGPGRYNFCISVRFHVKKKIVFQSKPENFITNHIATAYVLHF